ncbi:MAG TPA: hypothetical protein VFJ82_00450 [Longimicrobium sp.]|nr:hypothetical protein [Longimicrobium sp.]
MPRLGGRIDDRSTPAVLYLPVSSACEFQPYHGPEPGGDVRG